MSKSELTNMLEESMSDVIKDVRESYRHVCILQRIACEDGAFGMFDDDDLYSHARALWSYACMTLENRDSAFMKRIFEAIADTYGFQPVFYSDGSFEFREIIRGDLGG